MGSWNYLIILIFFLTACKPVPPASLAGSSIDSLPYFEKLGFASETDYQNFVACQTSGFVFNRVDSPNGGRCTSIPLASSYSCEPKSIHEKFLSLGIQLQLDSQHKETRFEEFADFDIDQCGEIKEYPLVVLIRRDFQDPVDYSIEVKNLCKSGSPSCL